MRSLHSALWVTAAFAACSFDQKVSPGSHIACRADAECPPGARCVAVVGQCAATTESTLPTLDEASLTPSLGRVGTRFEVRFTTSEPLLTEPSVAAFFRGVGVSVPFTLTSQEGLTYTFERAIVGTEPEGQATVLVDLTDTSGNRGERLPAGSLQLDFSAPYPSTADVLLLPWRGCPRFDVDRLGLGSVAKIAFSVEPGTEARLEPIGAEGLMITPLDGGPTQRLFEVRLLADPPQEREVAFNVRTRDVVGNEQVQPLLLSTPLRVDSVLPPSVERGDGGQWVLWRAPEVLRDGGSGAWLEVAPTALPAGLLVRVVATDGTVREGLTADGVALRVPLAASVGATASATTVDAACNLSPSLVVRDGAVILSTAASALHSLETSPLPTDGLFSPRTGAATRATAAADLTLTRVRAGAERQNLGRMLFDEGLGRVLLMGGRDDTNNVTERIQEWDGTGWRVLSTVLPSARDQFLGAFDRTSGHTVVFGAAGNGNSAIGLSNSVWLEYPQVGLWPAVRPSSVFTWDGEKVLLVQAGASPAFWAWTGAGFKLLDAGVVPSTYPAALSNNGGGAYDEARDRTIVVQSFNDGGAFTLEWDRQRLSVVGLGKVTTHLTYDRNLQRVVMADNGPASDAGLLVWQPDVGAWVPGPRLGNCAAGGFARAAFDRFRSELVVHSNNGTCALRADGGVWRLSPERPLPRLRPAMATSAVLGGTVVHGGLSGASPSSLSDTWLHDGVTWKFLDAGGPPARGGQLVPLTDGGLLLAADDLGASWVLAGTRWRRLDAGLPQTDGSVSAVARVDGGVFAYVDRVGTFEFDGTWWAQTGSAVGPVSDFALTLGVDGEPVSLGGRGASLSSDLLCTFTPTAGCVNVGNSGAAREGAGLVNDEARSRLLAIGGWTLSSVGRPSAPFLASFVGISLGNVSLGLEPGEDSPAAPRQQHTVTSVRRSAWVIFGGSGSPVREPTNDFFRLERGHGAPEVVTRFALEPVGLLQPKLTIVDLVLSGRAPSCVGAQGLGCLVDAFVDGRWREVAAIQNDAPFVLHLAPTAATYEIAGVVGVRLRANGGSREDGGAQASVETPELIVRYVSSL